MTDIGFGLIDRRTVIIVLFTLVLASILFGYQIPVDIQNVGNLFVDLVVLTGYIYLARTIYRLPVALFVSIIIDINIYSKRSKREDKKDENESQASDKNGNTVFRKLGRFIGKSIIWVILLIINLPFFIISLLYLILTFGEYVEKDYELISAMPSKVQNFYYKNYSSAKAIKAFFGILDRIGIVCVAAIATIPYFGNLVKIIGVSGLVAMVTIFTLRGDFTALIKDVLETKGDDGKKEKDKEKNAFDDEPSINIKNSISNPIYVEVVNTNERPLEIKNAQYVPLYVAVEYNNSLPVHIVNGTLTPSDYPFPVYVVNTVKTQQDDD